MKQLQTVLILLSFICFLFSSCIENETKEDETSNIDVFYEVKKNAATELNLNKLENGIESFELRLWSKFEVFNLGHVMIIKRINNHWTCLDYTYIESRKEVFDYITDFTIDTFWVKKKQPKSGWRSIFTEIKKEGIYDLPTQSKIDGWEHNICDGITFYIEFATKNKYKFYSYNCPDVYEDNFKECKHMTNILEVFDEEFGVLQEFGSYRCSDDSPPPFIK